MNQNNRNTNVSQIAQNQNIYQENFLNEIYENTQNLSEQLNNQQNIQQIPINQINQQNITNDDNNTIQFAQNLEIWIQSMQIYLGQQQKDEDKVGLTKNSYRALKKMKIGETSKLCSICCQSFQKGDIIRQTPCKHLFHTNCVKPWFKKNQNCPNCRLNLQEHFQESQKV